MLNYKDVPSVNDALALDMFSSMQHLLNNCKCTGLNCTTCPVGTPDGCAIVKADELFQTMNAVTKAREDGTLTVNQAPAKKHEFEPQSVPESEELTKLRNAFTLMRDMVDPNRDSRTDKYLFCPSSAGGTSPCNACPFDMEETCGIEQLRKLMLCMKGASDSSL